jgi:hypothetical protein
MEALQILKFSLKQKQLHFTDGWATVEPDMQDSNVEDGPDLLHGFMSAVEGAKGKIMDTFDLDDKDYDED